MGLVEIISMLMPLSPRVLKTFAATPGWVFIPAPTTETFPMDGSDTIEPMPEAEDDWVAHHNEVTQMTLLPRANSWWVGANIPGKPRNLYPYVGGVGTYRQICDEVAARDYDGFAMGSGGEATVGGFTGVARAKFLDVVSSAAS